MKEYHQTFRSVSKTRELRTATENINTNKRTKLRTTFYQICNNTIQ